MFKGSNIKGRFVVRRDIEKERYRRVRSSVVVFFVNLIDGFQHDGWKLVMISGTCLVAVW